MIGGGIDFAFATSPHDVARAILIVAKKRAAPMHALRFKSLFISFVSFLFDLFVFGRENNLPVVLHAHDRPAFGCGFVETLVELSDV
jgi:hypothetical protein